MCGLKTAQIYGRPFRATKEAVCSLWLHKIPFCLMAKDMNSNRYLILLYMEEFKLYAASIQGPESDEMYVDALRLHARIIRVLPKQKQTTMDQYLVTRE